MVLLSTTAASRETVRRLNLKVHCAEHTVYAGRMQQLLRARLCESVSGVWELTNNLGFRFTSGTSAFRGIQEWARRLVWVLLYDIIKEIDWLGAFAMKSCRKYTSGKSHMDEFKEILTRQ